MKNQKGNQMGGLRGGENQGRWNFGKGRSLAKFWFTRQDKEEAKHRLKSIWLSWPNVITEYSLVNFQTPCSLQNYRCSSVIFRSKQSKLTLSEKSSSIRSFFKSPLAWSPHSFPFGFSSSNLTLDFCRIQQSTRSTMELERDFISLWGNRNVRKKFLDL